MIHTVTYTAWKWQLKDVCRWNFRNGSKRDGASSQPAVMGREQKARRGPTQVHHASATTWREVTQPSKAKQNQHKDKSCNLKKHKKSNSRPNRAVWTVFVNCAHWRGSTLAIYKTVLIIFPLNLQTKVQCKYCWVIVNTVALSITFGADIRSGSGLGYH